MEEYTYSVKKGRLSLTSHQTPLGASFDPLHIQVETPYAFYAQIRQEEPITFSSALNAYLVSRYDDIRSILLRPDLFSSKNALGFPVEFYPQTITKLRKGLAPLATTISSDGARHLRIREPLQKVFSPTRVRTMEPFISAITTRLIDRFISDGQAEIISQFAYLLPLEVILSILGVPQQDLAMVKSQSDAFQMLIALPLPLEQQVECARQYVALQHYYAHLIGERRKQPENDLISDLIRYGAAGEEPFSDADLINQIIGAVIAGHETTTHLIGSGLVLLLEEPMRWQALCEHPESIPQAIEEILRLRGPVQGFFRTTTKQVTIGGVSMPQGTHVLLLYASGNHDESAFPHAGNFELQRQPNHHLAFGHGVHFCVGAPLARLEGRIAFEALTQRIPTLRLAPDQQFVYNFNLIIYGHKHIYVQWQT
jgi:cytochrome P450